MDFFFFFACFYCLKSGKCIIISFAFSFCFSKSRSSLPFRANVRFSLSFLCRSKWDTHKKWIFFFFFKVQIRLDSFKKRWIIVCVCMRKVVVVVVVGSTSLVVLDVAAPVLCLLVYGFRLCRCVPLSFLFVFVLQVIVLSVNVSCVFL